MKSVACSIALLGLALAFTGCRTHPEPTFDAYAPAPPRDAAATLIDDAEVVAGAGFQPVAITNEIPPELRLPPTNFFRLGPGDVIEIEVLGDAATRSSALVGPDGKIYYSILPGLFVWGKTLSETKELLDEQLQRFFRDAPQVGITLRGVQSRRIWILGSVNGPGVYALETPMTLLEALSRAGGTVTLPGSTSDPSDLKNSFIIRKGELLRVDFHKLLKEGDLSQNIYLQPDDFIFVRSAISSEVYVLGAVFRPGVVPYSEEISLLSAITLAGGRVPYAYTTHTAIIRGSLTEPKIAVVNFDAIRKGKAKDVLLQPGDIVYIPFAPYRKLAQFADEILSQFVRVIAVNEGRNAVLRDAGPVGVSVGVGYGIGP